MSIVEKYLKELKRAYYKNGGKEMWDNFEKIKEGASEEDIKKIKEEYPYYLLSSSQILESKDDAYKYYADYVDRKYEEVEIDEEIINDSKKMRWLHFSDCMNNGGTSQLFIDFSPSEKGVKGQVVRFLHDPDEIAVIADSFDEYLEELMEYELDFINEDTME